MKWRRRLARRLRRLARWLDGPTTGSFGPRSGTARTWDRTIGQDYYDSQPKGV